MSRNGPEYEVKVISFTRWEKNEEQRTEPFKAFNRLLEWHLSKGWELDQAIEFTPNHEWATCVVRRLRGRTSP